LLRVDSDFNLRNSDMASSEREFLHTQIINNIFVCCFEPSRRIVCIVVCCFTFQPEHLLKYDRH
jgi:hypothetical protein